MYKLKWNHIYYLLAAFDLIAISASLYLNYRVLEIYTDSVEVNYVWNDRIAALEDLRSIAIAVNAPGNDIFEDFNVDLHKERLNNAYALYLAQLELIRTDYENIEEVHFKQNLLKHIAKVELAMDEMLAESNYIFEMFSQNTPEDAGSRMAHMDRKAADGQSEIGALISTINAIQGEHFSKQIAYAQDIREIEKIFAVIVVLMVVMVTLYGAKLARTLKNYQLVLEAKNQALSSQAQVIADTEVRSQTIIEAVADGIIIVDVEGRVESANKSALQQFGFNKDEIIGQNIKNLISDIVEGEDNKKDINFYAESFDKDAHKELRVHRKNGEDFYVEMSISPFQDKGKTKFSCVVRDVSERKVIHDKITDLAMHDVLTGLDNRHSFTETFKSVLKRNLASDQMTALMVMDLDRFKNVNDTYGHPVGDKLLILIAERLQSICRASDVLARLGGDEFAVIMDNYEDRKTVAKLARRITEMMALPFYIDDLRIDSGVSIGISLSPEDDTEVDELIRKADLALYKAKAAQRRKYDFYREEMHHQMVLSKQLEDKLRHAYENDLFELYYQPQIDVTHSQLFGVEALIRWYDKDLGFISPVEFIPVAEQSGLILNIDLWVLEAACNQWQAWDKQGIAPAYMSVNISAKLFEQNTFVKDVRDKLYRTQMPPEHLQIEITETAALNDLAGCLEKISEMREMGVSFALDDFGTGHSSLTHLQQLSLDAVKIDRSFVTDIRTELTHYLITDAVIKLSQSLNMKLVAEGVEDQETKQALEEMGCHIMQGYYFSKPLPTNELEPLLISHSRLS